MHTVPRAAAGAGAAACAAASPLRACLDPSVPTPRSEERARGLLITSSSRCSLEAAAGEPEAAPAAPPGISAPPSNGDLQAAVRELDARLPLADILPLALAEGGGYLVVRRRLPAPAPSPATGSEAAAAAAAAGHSATALAAPGWTAADEARYQRSLQQLLQLVALRQQAWPRIRAWFHRAAGRAAGPGGEAAAAAGCSPGDTPQQRLLRWAVAQRLRHLQQAQRQWQRQQALKKPQAAAAPAVEEPAMQREAAAQVTFVPAHPHAAAPKQAALQEQPAPADSADLELEAPFALMQLAQGASRTMPPLAPRPPRNLQPPAHAAGAAQPAQPAQPAGHPEHKPTAKRMPHRCGRGRPQGKPAAKRRCLAAPAAC